MDRLIQMILNTVLRQLVNRGVRSGMDKLAGGKQATRVSGEAEQASDAKAMARKARQAANLAKRLGR